jgi:hypothetical protein
MDVRLPDGTIIKGVPDGMSKADLTAKLASNGYDVSKLAPAPAPAPAVAAAPAQPSFGQRAMNIIEPTVEMLGAAGGGMLGTPLGPAGIVGGAGLGYGLAKGGMRTLKTALGYEQGPQSVGEALTTGAGDVLAGATMEAGGRVIAPLVAKGVGAVMDLRQIPKQKAAEIARNALGPDLEAVKNALAQAPANVTASQATAGLNSPTWQALLQRAGQRDPRFLQALESSQGDVSLNALAKLAGGATATETRATSELAKTNLNQITGPVRETALKRANLGQYVADEASARAANDLAVLAGSGTKIDPAQFVAQATGAEQALRSVGIKPLESASLIRSISATAENPAFAGNDLVSGAVKNVADDIAKWTGQGGVIDANALEAIRKNSVNAAISQLRPGADATTQRNLAAGVLSKIKPAIDNAIEAAGGTGWRDYLGMHAKGMRDIAEKNLTGEALAMYKTNKDAFVKLVQGEAPEVVEKKLGPGSYDIAKEVSDKTLAVLQDQASKVVRDAAAKTQATAGQDALKELLLEQISKVRIPSYLSAVASTTNKALQILENKIGTKTMDVLTKASQTPEGAATLLDTLPASERVRVLNLLSNPQGWKPGTSAAGVTAVKNALVSEEPKNALVPKIELTGMAQ